MVPKYIPLLIVLLILVSFLVPVPTKIFALENTYKPNEVIVKFKNSSDLVGSFSSENVKGMSSTNSKKVLETTKTHGTLAKFNQNLDIKKVKTVVPVKINTEGTKSVKRLETPKNGLENVVKIEYNNKVSPKRASELLLEDPNIEWAEPNFIKKAYTAEPNDPFFKLQWSLKNTGQVGGAAGKDINLLKAWDIQKTAENIPICYIDTGAYAYRDYYYIVPDATKNEPGVQFFWKNPNEIPDNRIDDDKNGWIDDVYGVDTHIPQNLASAGCFSTLCGASGHGSEGVSIIASVPNNNFAMTGILQKAKVKDVASLSVFGSGTTEDVVKGLNYSVSIGCKIINASYGGGDYSNLEKEAMSQVKNAGILFVAAAGNDGKNLDTNPSYPANYDLDNIISVAATNNKGELASFSNYSSTKAHIAAPGKDIPVESGWEKDVTYVDGTSFSAPHVTAVSALVWAKNPNWNYKKVREAILEGGKTSQSLQGKVLNGKTLDAYGALIYGTNTPTPTPNNITPTPTPNNSTPTPPTPSLTPKYNPKYDANKDSKVDILDVIFLLQYIFSR